MITLAQQCIDFGITLFSVESVTGGLFAATLTQQPGASAYFSGGLVVYNDAIKQQFSRIPAAFLLKHRAISHQVTEKLADHGYRDAKVDVCISFTGNAGPSLQDDAPLGRCYTAIASKYGLVSFKDDLKGNRREIQTQLVQLGIQRLKEYIKIYDKE